MGPPTRAALCGSLWGMAVATLIVAAVGLPRATPKATAVAPPAPLAASTVPPLLGSAVEIGSPE